MVDPLVVDTTILRSFGVLGLGDRLFEMRRCIVVDTVFDPPDGGELGRIVAAIGREIESHQAGSHAFSLWSEALTGLDSLCERIPGVVHPDQFVEALAQHFHSREQAHRDWRSERGITVRRIDVGESVCIAYAMHTDLPFGTDDAAAASAYHMLTGQRAVSIFDLLDELEGDLDRPMSWFEDRLIQLRGPKRG